MPGDWTILDDQGERTLELIASEGCLLVRPEELERSFGWQRKPEGWCRDERCIPPWAVEHDEQELVDLDRFFVAAGELVVCDRAHRVLAVAHAPGALARSVDEAPELALPDLAGRVHRLSELRGRKVVLVAWGSWCGCRYELPAWEAQHRDLSPHGLSLVSVAIERRAADARPWIEQAEPTHLALIDDRGQLAERYNVLNVPSVIWIDEEGRLVRPPDTQFATDSFRAVNGLSSQRALAALRHWVLEDDPGLDAEEVERHWHAPDEDEQRARAEARLAAWLFAREENEAALQHLERAAQLAPGDLTIRRAFLPLRGLDPLGPAYFELREELTRRGVPVYRPLPDWNEPDWAPPELPSR